MPEHVEGEDLGSVVLYALSTCMWCRKTKQLLDDLHVAYDFIEVDLLDKAEQEDVTADVKKWNPDGTFPTVVINGEICIVGYEPDKIRAELHKWK